MFEIMRYVPLILGFLSLYGAYDKISDSKAVITLLIVLGIGLVAFGFYVLYTTRRQSRDEGFFDTFDLLELVWEFFGLIFSILKYPFKILLGFFY